MLVNTPELENEFPESKINQCISLRTKCTNCGEPFKADIVCTRCGTKRERCQNTKMDNENVCRVHARRRPYGIHTVLAGRLSDAIIEDAINSVSEGSHLEEFALAKIALMEFVKRNPTMSEPEIVSMVKDFFEIALKKKKLEEGSLLTISWDSKMVDSILLRFNKLVGTFTQLIDEYITDDFVGRLKEGKTSAIDLKRNLLLDLQTRVKLLGNEITAPAHYYETQMKKIAAMEIEDAEEIEPEE